MTINGAKREYLSRATRVQLWLVISLAVVLLLPSLFNGFSNPAPAYDIRVSAALRPPSSSEWFGTDKLGRSQWNRALIGTAVSLRTVAGSLAIALPASLVLGAIAGSYRGRLPDYTISWLIGLFHTVPLFLMVVAFAAIAGPGTTLLPYLIGSVIWAPAARLVRIETIRIMGGPFVRAHRACGMSHIQTLVHSVLPLTAPPAAVCLFFLVPEIIGIDAILTLFGLGPKPPTPSLGNLVFEGIQRWDSAPWLALGPSAIIVGICLTIHASVARIAQQLYPVR